MDTGRKLLILDLDYTLYYPSEIPLNNADCCIIAYGSQTWIKKRPYLDQFLAYANKNYDLMVWSASSREYVCQVVTHLLSDIPLVYVYSGERCTTKWNQFSDEPNPYVIKDLRKIWRRDNPYTKRNTLVLDDTPKTYLRNYGNAIPIDRYNGGANDTELLRVIEVLKRYHPVLNVRIKN